MLCFGTGTIVLLAGRFRRPAVQPTDCVALASALQWLSRSISRFSPSLLDRQIEPGRCDSDLLMAGSSRIQFVRARLGRRVFQKGAPPARMRSFGLLAARNIRIFLRGRRLTGDDLFVFPVEGAHSDEVDRVFRRS